MDRNVTSHLEVLKALHRAKPGVRKSLLKNCTCDLVRCIVECAHNTLKGNVPLKPQQHRKLKSHKSLLRKLAKKGESVEKKRKILVQKGSGVFLTALLAPLLGSVLGKLFHSS